MGIYDQIHGECPHCGCFIGRKKGEDGYSGIQIKDWITGQRYTTYDFYVGDCVPFMIDHLTGEPIVETFYEICHHCNETFKIPFESRREVNRDNLLIHKVIMLPFKKV